MEKNITTKTAIVKKTLVCAVVASAIASAVPFAVQAGSNSTNFTATLVLVNSCTISAANMTFTPSTPAQNNLSAVINASSNLSVLCTNTTPYSVSLGDGANGTIAQRVLSNSGTNVNYNLYTDTTYATIWGDGTTANSKTVGLSGSTVQQSSGGTLGGVGTGSTQTLTVYGQVAVQNAPAPGTYTDTIAATVNF